MTEQTPRLKAPYIIATQAQKEVSHNMALNLLDALVQTAVESALLIAPPPAPSEGGLWIVGDGAAGDWAGHDRELAQYIGGGWQFHIPFDGMLAWLRDENIAARFMTGLWQKGLVTATKVEVSGQQVVGSQQAAIADAAGGATIDAEARSALNSLLAACRAHGLIAG